ncbi:DUF3592 domain-containing protein [Pedobacter sp. KR3-3]|uniref:DUF3592 domain-containing protein n=1 Tax=Pedobacter albus TaxID=3113905 RepID=A0ABU7I9U8_9SPHI|nr:DUF3592 domain-containing protein [Pedobacter sp. KR3-3]MEE1946263.1 DUF3592 domain-containing protein [Pedobacter sp. KR3-3]
MPYLNTEQITAEVVDLLKYKYTVAEIEAFLQSKGVDPGDFQSIIATAEANYLEEKLSYLPQRHKKAFIIWTSLAVLCFALFVFYIPSTTLASNDIVMPIIGTVLFLYFLMNVIAYYKTWTLAYLQKYGPVKVNYGFWVIFLIPGFILCFLLSQMYEGAARDQLKVMQETAIGTVISGTAASGRRYEYATITVLFETKSGQTITATKSVSSSQFKQFYNGQKIELAYAKNNPQNIDLLIDQEHIRELKGTAERALNAFDLILLFDRSNTEKLEALNKINYGWQLNSKDSTLINERSQQAILATKRQLRYIGAGTDYITFGKFLSGEGYKRTNPVDSNPVLEQFGKKVLENNRFVVILQPSQENSIITFIKK